MKTETDHIASSNLGQVLDPLIKYLESDIGISIVGIENITGLPSMDPTTAAHYCLYIDYFGPERLFQLVETTGHHHDDEDRVRKGLELVPDALRGPIRFSLLQQIVCFDSECTHESYLLATTQPGMEGDIAGAERQVAALIEHFTNE